MIYGSRIEQARKLEGLTQKKLASIVGVHQSAIAQYEKELCAPSEGTLKDISLATGFQPLFFKQPCSITLPKGSLSYRALRSVPAKEEDNAYQYAKLLYEHVDKMAKNIALPSVNLSTLKEKPIKAAQLTRVALGLSPDMPINNLINILETNGVLVLSLPILLQKLDAFSTWIELCGKRPLIVTSLGKPGDRLRFSLTHELGHLVMHHPPRNSVKIMEKEASDFASEFLMPAQVMVNEFVKPISLFSIAKLKPKWGVSMQALIYRARTLKIISERQATYLFTQMSVHGWRKEEPSNLDVKIETPQLVRRIIEKLYDHPEDYAIDMYLSTNRATELALYV